MTGVQVFEGDGIPRDRVWTRCSPENRDDSRRYAAFHDAAGAFRGYYSGVRDDGSNGLTTSRDQAKLAWMQELDIESNFRYRNLRRTLIRASRMDEYEDGRRSCELDRGTLSDHEIGPLIRQKFPKIADQMSKTAPEDYMG
jgi:hypothetical protein